MKRFFKYLLTVFLITVFAVAMTFGVWALINSFTTHADHDLIYGTITSSSAPVAVEDKERGLFKDKYVINFVQTITVSFNYKGQTYSSTRDFSVYKEKSDVPLSTSHATYNNSPYKKGAVIQIYVNKNNPTIYSLAGDADSTTVDIKTVIPYAAVIYGVVLIIFTISYIARSKKERKQEFLEKYMNSKY